MALDEAEVLAGLKRLAQKQSRERAKAIFGRMVSEGFFVHGTFRLRLRSYQI